MIYGFFKFCFYLFAVVAIFYEFNSLMNYDSVQRAKDRLTVKDPVKFKANLTGLDILFLMFHIFYNIWAIIGLFSSQWVVFLLLIGLSLFQLCKFAKSKAWHTFDSIISLAFLSFMIINTYHLHINVGKAILGLFVD